jgi:hypothetical protein
MGFRPDANVQLKSGGISVMKSMANWRCGTCGQVFSAESLRKGARTKALIAEHTEN